MTEIPLNLASELQTAKFTNPINTGHKLRGEFMNHCAYIEDWMSRALASARDMNIDVKKPYLFGQKLKALTDLSETQINPFRKPKAVSEMLSELQQFSNMRGWMGHSIMTASIDEKGKTVFTFALPGNDSYEPGKYAKSINQENMEKLNATLKQLAKKLTDQKFKSCD